MIAFIILHYKNINDTIECIESIKMLKFTNYKIIVVENGSLDSSTNILRKIQYNVDVVFNEKNYGFAKGNNCGIRYAEQRYNPEFYVVINNDITINQENMLDEINRIEEKYEFDVLGPRIISNNGINQNPNYLVLSKNISIFKHLVKLSIIRLLIIIGLYDKVKKFNKDGNKKINKCNKEVTLMDVPLHGSALIFSSRYIKKYTEPFDESTFLYGEEEFLYYRRVRDGLKFVYSPDITVYHKEDAALNELFKENSTEKMKFVIRNSRRSLIKLLLKKINDKLGRCGDE